MKKILIIAATDSSSGAGLFQDIKVADRLGYWSFPVITGITLQTFQSLDFIKNTDDDLLKKQLDFALQNYKFNAIKVGAICKNSQIKIIKDFLEKTNCKNIVVDPVFSPSNGQSFIEDFQKYEELFLPEITITPNIPELKRILSLSQNTDEENLLKFGLSYSQKKNLNIYLTGGHSKNKDVITEYFISKDGIKSYQKKKEKWKYQHGTGCALSTAFSILNSEFNPMESVKKASNFVSEYFSELQNI